MKVKVGWLCRSDRRNAFGPGALGPDPPLLRSVLLAALVLASGCQAPEETPVKMSFEPGVFTPSQDCGTCHVDIHTGWDKSLHARSVTNPIFDESYREAIELDPSNQQFCLTCHAPTTLVTGDYELADSMTREGVHCDFCHSLTGTDFDKEDHPFELAIGDVKYGPIKDASSTGHEVGYSEFHESSFQCAGCHQYTNPNGVEVLSTYSEWEDYTESGGDKSCQGCHMPLILANIVDPKVKRIAGAFVNLHSMPGGHSTDQLSRSLRLRLSQVNRTDDGLRVQVTISNHQTGHSVPTGIPTRRVILNVAVASGDGVEFSEEEVFQRVLVDGDGKSIDRDSRIFTESAEVSSDTRISPGEVRVYDFSFPVPERVSAAVTATLTYLYSPHARPDTEVRMVFWTEKRELASQWEP